MPKIFAIVSILMCMTVYSQDVNFDLFADGFTAPLAIENAGDDRLFIVERAGVIKILNSDGSTNTDPFLDISSLVTTNGEGGLLGLTFHPDYGTNGYFYVNYADSNGDSQVSRFSVQAGDPDLADPASELSIINVEQPFPEHNIGTLTFGPDGYLYIGSGDGGSAGDPGDRAQDLSLLLGKMLRLDVDNPGGGNNYGIPADNPFVGDPLVAPEIWAYGLRNPWKFSIDEDSNMLWIGDVGQGDVEEIDRVDISSGGYNFGWRCYEGSEPFNTTGCPDPSELEFPFYEYSSSNGTDECSVTGGVVYRGSTYPTLEGLYFFADFCSGIIGTLDNGGNVTFHGNTMNTPVSFGKDINGEVYVASINQGRVYKIFDDDLGIADSNFAKPVMYPNPVQGSLKLTAQNGTPIDEMIIRDLQGKTVLMKRDIGNTNIEVNLERLATGLYLVETTNQEGNSFVQKLVKL